MIQIKSKFDARVLFELECGSLKLCVEAAIRSGADLSRANLSRANLSRADLSCADLSRANLSRANLSGANLSGADLSCADLSGADLSVCILHLGGYLIKIAPDWIEIGCQHKTLNGWLTVTADDAANMDGERAKVLFTKYRDVIEATARVYMEAEKSS